MGSIIRPVVARRLRRLLGMRPGLGLTLRPGLALRLGLTLRPGLRPLLRPVLRPVLKSAPGKGEQKERGEGEEESCFFP